jgi:hypothetical protein
MDKDDALFFGSMCSCVAFIGYIVCIIYKYKMGRVSNGVYLTFSIFSLLVEIGWLIALLIIYIQKYKKSKEINEKYYKTKECIYDTLNKTKDEFYRFYLLERDDRISCNDALLKTSKDHNTFEFKGVNGLYYWCTFDKSISLQENHVKYYIDAIDEFVHAWNTAKGNTSDICYLILIRNNLYKLQKELLGIEYDMRCI